MSTPQHTNPLYPIFLLPERLNILVVGGGNVGLEKLTSLLKNSPQANVKMVAADIFPETLEYCQEKVKRGTDGSFFHDKTRCACYLIERQWWKCIKSREWASHQVQSDTEVLMQKERECWLTNLIIWCEKQRKMMRILMFIFFIFASRYGWKSVHWYWNR